MVKIYEKLLMAKKREEVPEDELRKSWEKAAKEIHRRRPDLKNVYEKNLAFWAWQVVYGTTYGEYVPIVTAFEIAVYASWYGRGEENA